MVSCKLSMRTFKLFQHPSESDFCCCCKIAPQIKIKYMVGTVTYFNHNFAVYLRDTQNLSCSVSVWLGLSGKLLVRGDLLWPNWQKCPSTPNIKEKKMYQLLQQ